MFINKNLFTNMLILPSLITIIFLSLSLSDLILIWFFMEMSNFLFISLFSMNSINKKIPFFYFMIQFISSSILMLLLILNLLLMSSSLKILISFSLFFKLNIPPFHLWMLPLINSMKWNDLFLILYIQKFIPFYILSFFIFNSYIFWLTIFTSLILAPFNLLNTLNLKFIFFYSSINNLNWIIIILIMSTMYWLIYFTIYSLISMFLMILINYLKINFNLKIYSSKFPPLLILFLFFNISGIPPFSIMILKWLNIHIFLMNSNFFITLIMLMFNSLIMLWIYMRMSHLNLFWISSKNKIIYFNKNNQISYIFFFLFSSIFFSLTMLLW